MVTATAEFIYGQGPPGPGEHAVPTIDAAGDCGRGSARWMRRAEGEEPGQLARDPQVHAVDAGTEVFR
jgi:hypothetical protein